MRLPNLENAVVSKEKVVGYLLADTGKNARVKAGFFLRFGFTRADWRVFQRALLQHGGAHEVKSVSSSIYGERYTVVGELACPDGRRPIVETVWIVDKGFDIPRLITAYPSKRRKNDQRA